MNTPNNPGVKPVPGPSPTPSISAPRMNLKDLPRLNTRTDFLTVGYYGQEGTGKTTSLLDMANFGPVLLVNAEAGAKPEALARRGINTDNIVPWPSPGVPINFDTLESVYLSMQADLLADPTSWAGVGFDSLTEIVRVFLANERERQFRGAGKARDRWFTDRSDYGVTANQVSDILRKFRSLPCHFGFTALERRDTDSDGKVMYGPNVTPALMADIPGFVDVLIHCVAVTPDVEDQFAAPMYAGWTRPHDKKYRGKDRNDSGMPNRMPSPSFGRILAYVRGDLTKDSDAIFQAAKAAAQSQTATPAA